MARARRSASGFLRDFQEFALKGSVVDLAIAVIIGTAFSRVITSFVEDVPIQSPLSDPKLAAQERLTGALDRLNQTLESRNNQVL